MSSIQERLQLKRVPLDTWNIREQLCLASAVVRSGDQNWMSVSRALKTVGEANRPPDWYSQKSCAAQYGALLEHVETPKRKKRSSGSDATVETPQESILKRLTQERIVEIQKNVAEMTQQYEQHKNDITEARNPATSDDRLREMWNEIEAAKRTRERETARRAAWLKEREERRARAERTWRPPHAPHSSPPQAQISSTTAPAPPSSPLLTSLLKSSPVVTTPQHIPHPATVVETVSPSAGAPTLSMLLEKSGSPSTSPRDNKHAAIENIKNEFLQIEQQLKATAATPPPVLPAPAPAPPPSVDIDDIEIKAEDVYAFRDIDIHIPPVATIHKPAARVEKPVQKIDEHEIPAPPAADSSDQLQTADEIKEEPSTSEQVSEEMLPVDIESIAPTPMEADSTSTAVTEEPSATCSAVAVEMKFPAPEIKFPGDLDKVKEEEIKEVEVPILEQSKADKVEDEEEDVNVEDISGVEEEPSHPPPPPLPPKEETPEPQPDSSQGDQPVDDQPSQQAPLPDPGDIPLPPATQPEEIPPPSDDQPSQQAPLRLPDPGDIPLPPATQPEEIPPPSGSSRDLPVDDQPSQQLPLPDPGDIPLPPATQPEEIPPPSGSSRNQPVDDQPSQQAPLPDPGDIPLPPATQPEEIPPPSEPPLPPEPEIPQEPQIEEENVNVEIEEEAPQTEIKEEKREKTVAEEVKKEDDVEEEDSLPLKEIVREDTSRKLEAETEVEVKEEPPPETEETHTETDDDTPMELSREEEKDGKKKRDYSRKKKPDSRTCSGSESAAEASAPESPGAANTTEAEKQHRLWKKSVMLVYSRLCAHKYASIFLRPISDEEAPGYSIVVKRPMDLTTIRKNIESGTTRTTAEFQRDVLQMLSNALMYNSSSHEVYMMAKEMFQEAQNQLGMLLAAQAHAGLVAPSSPAPLPGAPLPARRKRRRPDSPQTPTLTNTPKQKHY
ncbi:hypothetical protein O0L34_g10627 [Tuta absoluta]|nr:hypothetical protein O0L34_g10627 [Tuta absoluta]